MSLVLVTGYEFYLRANGAYNFDSTTAVGLEIFQPSEQLAWEHIPGKTVADYKGEELFINQSGHRDKVKDEKTSSILLLGDSFTFGINVPQSKTFASLLDEMHEGVDYFNAGVIGYSTDIQAAYLNKYALHEKAYKFDMVVLNFFVGNDVTELRRHNVLLEENELPAIVEDIEISVGDDNTLQTQGVEEPWSYAIYDLKKKFQALVLKFGLNSDDSPTLTWPVFLAEGQKGWDPNLPVYWIQIEDYLTGIKRVLDDRDIDFFVNIIPMDVQVSKSYWGKYPGMPFDDEAFEAKRPQVALKNLFEKNGIDYVDLLEVFSADPRKDEIYFENDDSHFTSYGHQVVADVIFEKMQTYIR